MRYVILLTLALASGCTCPHARWYSQGNGTTVVMGGKRWTLQRCARVQCLDCGRCVGAWTDASPFGQIHVNPDVDEEWRDR